MTSLRQVLEGARDALSPLTDGLHWEDLTPQEIERATDEYTIEQTVQVTPGDLVRARRALCELQCILAGKEIRYDF